LTDGRVIQTMTDERGTFIANREKVEKTLQSFARKPIELVLRPIEAGRSVDLNAYYFGVIVKIISEHYGYETWEVHEWLKDGFQTMLDPVYGPEVEPEGIAKILNKLGFAYRQEPEGFTTKTLNNKRFMGYCEAIKRLFAEVLYIPDPNETDC